jgi:DNA ligase 1
MKLYNIIKSLQEAQGNIEKQAILDANKDNELFKAYMKAVYDVGINYYQKKLPKGPYHWNMDWSDYPDGKYDPTTMLEVMAELANRTYTGDKAVRHLKDLLCSLSPEGKELVGYMLDRKIGASVGDTMVLKTWPDLYFLPPYQRCSLLDVKARQRFAKLKKFYVQTKADGSFAYVVKRLDDTVDVITRQGSKYPQWFAQKLAYGLKPGKVLVGELLVDEKMQGLGSQSLERKTANGLLNSALKDGEKFDESRYSVHMEAWDLLTQEEFEAGKSLRTYEDRLESLEYEVDKIPGRVSVIYTKEVTNLDEAFAIYQEHLQRGLEGCIIKDPASLWKDGTAKDIVKLKIKFAVEMRVNGMYEGEGKAKGMLGGVYIESEDSGIQCACGSGFSDPQRKEFWEKPWLIEGAVVTVEANDITQSREVGKKPSLSLPIFVEVRSGVDKNKADTTERIYAQLEAAKQGA